MIGYLQVNTSGTTGESKALLRPVEGLMWQSSVEADLMKIVLQDRIALTRHGTAGINQMFLAWSVGATLVQLPDAGWDVTLIEAINAAKITVLPLLATTFRHMLYESGSFPTVRLVDVGGEIVTGEDLELFKERFSDDCIFSNRYSSTETGVVSRWFATKKTPRIEGRLPVGHPLPGVEVSILNRSGSVLDRGEILVRSSYAALQYVDNPELTAAKLKDGRWHTGDVGYFGPDGILMHEGRKTDNG